MGNFNLTITNEGAAFLADVIANQGSLEFTEVRFSSTNYVGSEAALTEGTFGGTFITAVPSASILDQTTIDVAAAFDNTTFTVAKQLYSIGVIAKDGDGNIALVAVCTTSVSDTIPAYMAPGSNYAFNINMTVSSTDHVTVTGSVAGVLHVADIVDDLNSYETNKPLSARQGRILKELIPSSGMFPHVIVISDSGSVVTLTKGAKVITASETSTGHFEADVDEYGTWTIDSILAGDDAQTTLNIDAVKIYTVDDTHFYANVTVTFPTNATVSLSKPGETTLYATSSPYTFTVHASGTWTVTKAVNNVTKWTKTVSLTTMGQTESVTVPTVMGVEIDLTDDNPTTCCSYIEDAVGMTKGSSSWDSFFGHYPCLFEAGAENVKLNPDDFTKDIDGNSVDITSGASGDVMIAFPRRGLKISRTANVVTVLMTDETDSNSFDYYAHTRGSIDKDVFYVGTYLGYSYDSKLRSLSGKAMTRNISLGSARTLAEANGTGYEVVALYQMIFIQAMYALKYASLNSQNIIGGGYVKPGHNAPIDSGGSEDYGMDSEIIRSLHPTYMTDQEHHVKCFGIEDLWGNTFVALEGALIDSSCHILTATDSFNNSGTGYTDQGQIFVSDISGYESDIQGTSELGFVPAACNGSATTYFCDYSSLTASKIFVVGSGWSNGSEAGIFRYYAVIDASGALAAASSRLMYL